jgi:hypothetical protein
MHAAERHAHELAVRGARDRLAERRLTHAGRPDEAENRRLDLFDALLHREILENAFLHLLETEVVFIQHAFGVREVVVDLALLAPRQADQRVDVVAHDGRFRGHRRHQLELLELCIGLLLGFLRHARGSDALLEFFEIRTFLAFAQFLLDSLDLLVQVVLALALFHLTLHAPTDALFDLKNVDFRFELREQMLQTLDDREHLEDVLFLVELERQMRGDGVSKTTRLVDARQRSQDFRRNLLVELHVLIELRDDRAAQRFGFGAVGVVGLERHHIAGKLRFLLFDRERFRALQTLDEHLHGAVGQLEHLQDVGDTSHLVHVFFGRLVLRRRFLGDEHDVLAAFHRGFQGLDRLGPPHEERNHHMREYNYVAQREQRQRDAFLRQELGS